MLRAFPSVRAVVHLTSGSHTIPRKRWDLPKPGKNLKNSFAAIVCECLQAGRRGFDF